jgi:hypothetical protein
MRGRCAALHGAIAAVAAWCAVPALAHEEPRGPAEPAGVPAFDPASIPLPDLDFVPDAEAERNYDKYFYFHREETEFEAAFADILECDGYARGLAHRTSSVYVSTYPFTGVLPAAIGSAVGNAVADAIWGSAERRLQRRLNMRTCMTFKGYRTYGLPKDLWEPFNFEEGNRQMEEGRRHELLRVQARVASGPTPSVGEMMQ